MTDSVLATEQEKRAKHIEQAVRERMLSPGKQMPNRGIILQQALTARHDWANEYIVLAVVEDSFQPFVTWRRTIGVEQKADKGYGPIEYCWSGGYFRQLDDALMDYENRVESNMEDSAR